MLVEIEAALEDQQRFVEVEVSVPYARSDMVDRFHRLGHVEETRYDERGTTLVGMLPEGLLASFSPFLAIRGKQRSAGRATGEARSPGSAA